MSTTVDIAVIGNGLAGLAAAAALAQRGFTVQGLAPYPPKITDGRTTAIAAQSKNFLTSLDVWQPLAARAEPIWRIHITDSSSTAACTFAGDSPTINEPLGYIVDNAALVRSLEAAGTSAGVIWQQTTVSGWDSAGTTATLHTDTKAIQTRLCIAADGKHSTMRQLAGLPFIHRPYPQTALTATLSHSLPHNGVAYEHFLPDGPLAILPMNGQQSCLVWTLTPEKAAILHHCDATLFAEYVAQYFGSHLGDFTLASPRWCFPLTAGHAPRYSAPRLCLLGEAAHPLHPIAGQGYNLTLRDVASLASVLYAAQRAGEDIGSMPVLQRFERQRKPDTRAMLAATDGLNSLFMASAWPVVASRRAGLALVNRWPKLKHRFMRHAMGYTSFSQQP